MDIFALPALGSAHRCSFQSFTVLGVFGLFLSHCDRLFIYTSPELTSYSLNKVTYSTFVVVQLKCYKTIELGSDLKHSTPEYIITSRKTINLTVPSSQCRTRGCHIVSRAEGTKYGLVNLDISARLSILGEGL
jgi:hypothetical protein